MRAPVFASLCALTAFVVLAAPAPAATEFVCGPDGKPNASTKKCDCPATKMEQTDAKGTSRCVPRPPDPKPTSKPSAKPTATTSPKTTASPTSTSAPTSTATTSAPTPTATTMPTLPTPTTTSTNMSLPDPAPLPTGTPAIPTVVAPTSTVLTKSSPVPPVLAKSSTCPAGTLLVTGGTFAPTPYYSSAKKKPMTIVPFCLDATEVTVEAYAKCVGVKACSEPNASYDPTSRPFCNWGHPKGRAKHPINCVDVSQAKQFCKAAGKRLPFAEEWEWAARGGNAGTTYPWGNVEPVPSLVNACAGECPPNYAAKTGYSTKPISLGADPYPETAPVGSFPPGNFGLYDMAGNVAEFTVRMNGISDVELWGGSFLSDEASEVSVTGRGSQGEPTQGFRCLLPLDSP